MRTFVKRKSNLFNINNGYGINNNKFFPLCNLIIKSKQNRSSTFHYDI